MKSMMFCLLGAAAGTVGLIAFDTAALSRSDISGHGAAGGARAEVERQVTADNIVTTSDGRKVRVVYPAR
jgi:hypothetical protein